MAYLGSNATQSVELRSTRFRFTATEGQTTFSGNDANGVSLTASAFESSFPIFGNYILLVCVMIFSVSSLFSYSYYGTKCLSFLMGDENKKKYNYST